MDKDIVGGKEVNSKLTKDKVIALYKFILDLSVTQQKPVLNIENYDWHCDI